MEGGYQIIDLKGIVIPVNDDPITVSEEFYEIINNTRKPIMIENVVLLDGATTVEVRYFVASVYENYGYISCVDYGTGYVVEFGPSGSLYATKSAFNAALTINSTLEIDENGALGVKPVSP